MHLHSFKQELLQQLGVLTHIPYTAENTVARLLREYGHNDPDGKMIAFPVPLDTPEFFVHGITMFNGTVGLLTYDRYWGFGDGLALVTEEQVRGNTIREGNVRPLHMQNVLVAQLVLKRLLVSKVVPSLDDVTTPNTYVWCTLETGDLLAIRHG